jgi:hypothetical protein
VVSSKGNRPPPTSQQEHTNMNTIKTAYLAALAQYELISEQAEDSDELLDVDYEAAGEPDDFTGFYATWAEANPERAAEAQRLCLAVNAARAVLDAAADVLLDWSLATVLPLAKTEADRADLHTVRSCTRPNVRAKAIDLALRLAA